MNAVLSAEKKDAKHVIKDMFYKTDPRYKQWITQIEQATSPIQIDRIIKAAWDCFIPS